MAGYVSVRLTCTLSWFVRIVAAVVAAVTKEVEVDATTGTAQRNCVTGQPPPMDEGSWAIPRWKRRINKAMIRAPPVYVNASLNFASAAAKKKKKKMFIAIRRVDICGRIFETVSSRF